MEHLSDEQIGTLRSLIDSREKTLQGEVRAADEEAAAAPQMFGGEVGDAVDIGDQRYQAGMAHVDKQRDQEELMAIDAVRARMTDGSYGECADCSRPIPFERLQAQPTAVRCVTCQERYEQTHPSAPLFSV